MLEFIDFNTIRPPVETPMWVKQDNGVISIAAYHNNGMGCTGLAVCEVDLENETINVSNNEFILCVTHWAVLEGKQQILNVLNTEEGKNVRIARE